MMMSLVNGSSKDSLHFPSEEKSGSHEGGKMSWKRRQVMKEYESSTIRYYYGNQRDSELSV